MRSALIFAGLLLAGTAWAQTPNSATGTSAINPADIKTYKGTLVDASCALPGASTGSATPATSGNQACPVSTSTKNFAVRLEDGRTVKVDSVGEVRVQDTIKEKKNWSAAASSGKPIHAKIDGILNGNTLTVVSLK